MYMEKITWYFCVRFPLQTQRESVMQRMTSSNLQWPFSKLMNHGVQFRKTRILSQILKEQEIKWSQVWHSCFTHCRCQFILHCSVYMQNMVLFSYCQEQCIYVQDSVKIAGLIIAYHTETDIGPFAEQDSDSALDLVGTGHTPWYCCYILMSPFPKCKYTSRPHPLFPSPSQQPFKMTERDYFTFVCLLTGQQVFNVAAMSSTYFSQWELLFTWICMNTATLLIHFCPILWIYGGNLNMH